MAGLDKGRGGTMSSKTAAGTIIVPSGDRLSTNPDVADMLAAEGPVAPQLERA